MAPDKKERYLTIRVSEKELQQYGDCADMVGLTTSSWVRFTLKQAVDAAKQQQRAQRVQPRKRE